MKKCISPTVVLLTLFAVVAFVGHGNYSFSSFVSAAQFEEKIYSSININDNFEDDKVLVVMNKQASLQFKQYIPKDFPGVDCKKIENLTRYTEKKAKVKHNASNGKGNGKLREKKGFEFDLDTYRCILSIELKCKGKQNVIRAIEKLERNPNVLSAEPCYKMFACSAPEPKPQHYDQQWALNKISLPAAWDRVSGDDNAVYVGVLDSGIDASHPDLSNHINASLHMDFTGASPVSITTPTDVYGHGTHVAGIIGAGRTSGTPGVTGVCPGVKLISLKIITDTGSSSPTSFINALDYAHDKNIPILNFSGGYGNNAQYSNAMANAIKMYPGLLVCAAGNNGYSIDYIEDGQVKIREYPAGILPRPKNLITVGNSTNNDSSYVKEHQSDDPSNYGPNTVDLFAPGVDIMSTYPTANCTDAEKIHLDRRHNLHYADGYHTMTGTSMAASFVTGVAALIMSKRPIVNAAFLKKAILDNIDPIYALSGKCITGGRLNAYKAMSVAVKKNSGIATTTAGRATWTLYRDGTGDISATADTANCPNYDGYPSYLGEFKAITLTVPFMFGEFESIYLYFGTSIYKKDKKSLIAGNYYYYFEYIAFDLLLFDCLE